MEMDCQFISIYYGKFVTSQTVSFSRADNNIRKRFLSKYTDTQTETTCKTSKATGWNSCYYSWNFLSDVAMLPLDVTR